VGGNADLKKGGNRGQEDTTDDFDEFHEGECIRSGDEYETEKNNSIEKPRMDTNKENLR
jgi:hypothetical protein